jgi:hypothetical protein
MHYYQGAETGRRYILLDEDGRPSILAGSLRFPEIRVQLEPKLMLRIEPSTTEMKAVAGTALDAMGAWACLLLEAIRFIDPKADVWHP